MGKTVRKFDILISCPSDIKKELDIIDKVVKSFNSTIGNANDVIILTKHWETDSYAQSGGTPQDLLNEQIVIDSDAIIAVFWTRFGSPTENYGSGTEEEIELLLEQGKQVFLYFSNAPISPSEYDDEQYKKIGEFKSRYESRGIYKTYTSFDEFEKLLTNDLSLYFLNRIKDGSQSKNAKNNSKLSVKSVSDNKLIDQLIFKESNFTNTKFISEKKQKIKEKIEKIRDVKFGIIAIEGKNYKEDDIVKIDIEKIDDGEQKSTDVQGVIPEVRQTLSRLGANIKLPQKKLGDFINELSKSEKVYIKEEEKQLINKFITDTGLNIDENKLYDLGNLSVKNNLLPTSSYFGTTLTYSGTDAEKEKFELLKELIKKVERYYSWLRYFEELDSKVYLKLVVSNDGTAFDEDVDVKLYIKKGYLTRMNEIPKPKHIIMKDAINLLPVIYKINSSHIIDEYIREKAKIQSIPPITPPLSLYHYDKDWEELENDFKAEISDVFYYEYYEDDEFDIISFNIEYLKQNTNMAFPSILVFDKEVDEIYYEINAKYSPKLLTDKIYLGEK